MSTNLLALGRRDSWEGRGQYVLPVALVGFTVALILLPLLTMIMFSLREGPPWNPGAFTLDNYVVAYTDSDTFTIFGNTLLVAAASTAISVSVAILFAFLTERTDLPYRNVAWGLMLIPMAMPGLLFAVSWTLMLSPRIGMFNVWLRELFGLFGLEMTEGPFNIYSLSGMIFLEGMRGVTTTFLIMVGAFRAMDPSVEEAARTSGASNWTTLRRVSLPLLAPAILGATMYTFMEHLESLEIPIIIGLPAKVYVFPTYIYFTTQRYTPPQYGLAAALSVTFVLVSILLIYGYRRILGSGGRYATVTGKGYRPRIIPLGKWRIPLFAAFVVFFFLAIGAPALALLWSSFLPSPQAPSWELFDSLTLRNYVRIYNDRNTWDAVWNTLYISLGAATLTMGLSLTLAWVAVRMRSRWGAVLDGLAFQSQSLPGIVIGIALIFFSLQPPFDLLKLYGSMTIVVFGLTLSYLSFGARMMAGALEQVHKELEEAGRTSGAKWSVIMRRIVVPLLIPSFISGWIWVVTHALRNLSVPLLLTSRENKMLSVLLWHTWDDGASGRAAALGVGMLVGLGAITILGRWAVTSLSRQQQS